jgi:hypothetical protein
MEKKCRLRVKVDTRECWPTCRQDGSWMFMLQSEPENRLYQILLDKSSSTDGHLSILVLTGEI